MSRQSQHSQPAIDLSDEEIITMGTDNALILPQKAFAQKSKHAVRKSKHAVRKSKHAVRKSKKRPQIKVKQKNTKEVELAERKTKKASLKPRFADHASPRPIIHRSIPPKTNLQSSEQATSPQEAPASLVENLRRERQKLRKKRRSLISQAEKSLVPEWSVDVKDEVWGLIVITLSLFLMLSLFTYRSLDEAFTSSGDGQIHNWIGPLGAYIADATTLLFGLMAFVLPFMGFYTALRFFKGETLFFRKSQVLGALLITIGMNTFFALFTLETNNLPFLTGGLIGLFFSQALIPLCSTVGTGLIALLSIMSGVILFSGESVISFWKKLKTKSQTFLHKLQSVSNSKTFSEQQAYNEDNDENDKNEFFLDDYIESLKPESSHREYIFAHKTAAKIYAEKKDKTSVTVKRRRGDDPNWVNFMAKESILSQVDKENFVTPSSLSSEFSTQQHNNNYRSDIVAQNQKTDKPDYLTSLLADWASNEKDTLVQAHNNANPLEKRHPQKKPSELPQISSEEQAILDAIDKDEQAHRRLQTRRAEAKQIREAAKKFELVEPSEVEIPASHFIKTPATKQKRVKKSKETKISKVAPIQDKQKTKAKNSKKSSALKIVERSDAEKIKAKSLKLKQDKSSKYIYPPLKLLDYDAPKREIIDEEEMYLEADKLIQKFADFGIRGHVREVRPGPVVTTYEFVPAPGIKVSKIASLADDIAMAMEAVHIRIVAPIPGKGAVGIEIPNTKREMVFLKEIIATKTFTEHPEKKLLMALGKDIEGKPYTADLAEMPHVLVSGTTGSGKSVSVNGMICSLLYRCKPDELKFLMIDPKMLELSIYDGIPHLLLPPIIDSNKAANALKWAVQQMEVRYLAMSTLGVRDLKSYNETAQKIISGKDQMGRKLPLDTEGRVIEHFPYIVIIIDEYADLLSVAGKEVEGYVMRLAQKARAAGMHVMLATQRPSVDVITGVIKANFPVRMGFRLASSHDSKTIINQPGAEKLLGKGDMLIMPAGTSNVTRVHGAYVSENEIHRLVQHLKKQQTPVYDMSIIEPISEQTSNSGGSGVKEKDVKWQEALQVVVRSKKISISWLQRQLGVGYNRAAKIVEAMEAEGLISKPLNNRGDRDIHITAADLEG